MKITPAEVRRIAALARLALTASEEERLAHDLDKILQHVEKLNEIETSQIEPFTHAVTSVNAFRTDEAANSSRPAALLANAPDKDQSFFKVPKIIE
jgi:aspartyl-tRNA(Asn)/glutamyl-tRNA(Gln) amidotransferase subunit C